MDLLRALLEPQAMRPAIRTVMTEERYAIEMIGDHRWTGEASIVLVTKGRLSWRPFFLGFASDIQPGRRRTAGLSNKARALKRSQSGGVKNPDNRVSSRNNEPAVELFLSKIMEVPMPILLWLMGVPAIVVIALVLMHVI
jgi:hypothetical protein